MSPQIIDMYLMLLKEDWTVVGQYRDLHDPEAIAIEVLPKEESSPYEPFRMILGPQ